MRNKILIISLLFFAFEAAAQSTSASSGTCNAGNAENIGQHIIDWLLCGASLTNPQSTLFSALSLVLNTFCLTIAIYTFSINGLKWVWHTTQYGVPGGNNGKIHGGITVLRTALLLTLLAPIAEGFSPIQVLMRNIAEIGKDSGDLGASVTGNYLSTKGAITNVDIQNVEEVTSQIIASIMCAKIYEQHHQMDFARGLIEPGTEIIKPISVVDGDMIQIQWTYINPFKESNFFGNRTDYSALVGTCGTINFVLPETLSESTDTEIYMNGASQLSVKTSTALGPYAEIANDQFTALWYHINNVENILKDVTRDLKTVADVSTLKSFENPQNVGAVDSAHKRELEEGAQIRESFPEITKALVQANIDYRNAISDIGKNAALAVNQAENVRSGTCESPKYEKPVLLEKDKANEYNEIISRCVDNESWSDQLDRQGFVALGAYYVVHLKLNERIIKLQQHLVSATNNVPLYENLSKEGDHHEIIKAIAHSPASSDIYNRFYVILGDFMKNAGSSTFKMNFSAVENLGTTQADDESSLTGNYFSKIIKGWIANFTSFLGSLFLSGNGSGDLILNMMSLGWWLLTFGQVILALVVGLAFIPFLRGIKIFGSLLGKGGGSGDGGGGFLGGITGSLTPIGWALLIIGGLLFYGLPAVPLLKWVLEVQSWAIMLFMSFIYAPIWVMAHASITDDRFMAEHTQSGYGMIHELLLRPFLMVVSFYAMIKLMHISDIGFTMMMSYLMGIGSTGFSIAGIFFTVLIAILTAIQLCFRCFDLISLLSDYIISRIGFGARPLGDAANDRSHSPLIMASIRGANKMGKDAITSAAGRLGMIQQPRSGLDTPKTTT